MFHSLHRRIYLATLASYVSLIGLASAGMTVITVRDVAEARLQSISFFIFIYLVLAWAVKLLWNYLAKSFDWMPAINYLRALCLMLVSGLFLYVILTMISGARELMTPGAWEKKGIGYTLSSETANKRLNEITRLKNQLWSHAELHDGKFPPRILNTDNSPYFTYLSGRGLDEKKLVLAYEPFSIKGKRYVLFTDGSIEELNEGDIKKRIKLEKNEN